MTRRAGLSSLIFVLAACAVGSGCNTDSKIPPPKFRLEGSLTQVMDLSYDEARILVAPSDISLTFVRIKPLGSIEEPDGGMQNQMMGVSEDYPIKIAYQLDGEGLDGGRLDLASLDSNGSPRGVISRNVQDDPRNTFPTILRGTLIFNQALTERAVVTGDFNITFENGTEVASGRTVFSKAFTAQVQP